jgi:general secretion pathway protein H
MNGLGMTLIELMVSLGIVAILFAGVVMSVGAITGARAKEAAGELGGVIRSLYDTASLSGKTCRLVFQLPSDKDSAGARYWAECAKGNVTTQRDRDQALREATRAAEEAGKPPPPSSKSSFEDQAAQEKNRVEEAAKYASFTSPEIQPRALKGVQVSVWTEHQHDKTQTGLAYLYFFPQGYTEKAQVWFKQGGNTFTITVSPLTGKTAVVGQELEVPKS